MDPYDDEPDDGQMFGGDVAAPDARPVHYELMDSAGSGESQSQSQSQSQASQDSFHSAEGRGEEEEEEELNKGWYTLDDADAFPNEKLVYVSPPVLMTSWKCGIFPRHTATRTARSQNHIRRTSQSLLRCSTRSPWSTLVEP
jgi:hypothetical protein